MKWNDSHELCAPQYLARSVDLIVNHVCTQNLPFTYATSHSTSPSYDKAKVYTHLTTLIYAISQRSSVYPFRWLHRPINVCSCNVANCATGTALKAEECLSNIKQREKDPIKVIIKWEAVLVKDESFMLVSKKCATMAATFFIPKKPSRHMETQTAMGDQISNIGAPSPLFLHQPWNPLHIHRHLW